MFRTTVICNPNHIFKGIIFFALQMLVIVNAVFKTALAKIASVRRDRF